MCLLITWSYEMVRISVLVRGEITSRQFETWSKQFPTRVRDDNGVVVSNEYSPQAEYLIVDGKCDADSLRKWTRGTIIGDHVSIVNQDWAVQSLKKGKLEIPDAHTVNVAQSTDTTSNNNNNNNNNNNINNKNNNIDNDNHNNNNNNKSSSSSSSDAIGTGSISSHLLISDTGGVDISDSIQKQTLHQSANENALITDILDEFESTYELLGDEENRALSYKAASSSLKSMHKVTNIQQLDGVYKIGAKQRATIKEIMDTGKSVKLENLKNHPRNRAIIDMSRVWGLGTSTANALFLKGLRSVEDLRSRGTHLLNAQQLIGLDYVEEFETKIPRMEVEEIFETVKAECMRLNPQAACMVCGSFRRGKSECGDVDILIIPSSESGLDKLPYITLPALILALEKAGFLTHHLALPTGYHRFLQWHEQLGGSRGGDSKIRNILANSMDSNAEKEKTDTNATPTQSSNDLRIDNACMSNSATQPSAAADSEDDSDIERETNELPHQLSFSPPESTKQRLFFGSRFSYMGVCQLPFSARTSAYTSSAAAPISEPPKRLHRRIDIKMYPRHQFPFALLYFTGSDYFNRKLRQHAADQGLALDDKRLQYCSRADRKIVWRGAEIACQSEKDIFDRLGVVYLQPHERITFDPHTMLVDTKNRTQDASSGDGDAMSIHHGDCCINTKGESADLEISRPPSSHTTVVVAAAAAAESSSSAVAAAAAASSTNAKHNTDFLRMDASSADPFNQDSCSPPLRSITQDQFLTRHFTDTVLKSGSCSGTSSINSAAVVRPGTNEFSRSLLRKRRATSTISGSEGIGTQ